jgi:hypothetical protein
MFGVLHACRGCDAIDIGGVKHFKSWLESNSNVEKQAMPGLDDI